jgi:hypothetical protein
MTTTNTVGLDSYPYDEQVYGYYSGELAYEIDCQVFREILADAALNNIERLSILT